MPLSSLSLAAIMVSHSSGHFLIIHLLRSVGLHAAPRLGKLRGAVKCVLGLFRLNKQIILYFVILKVASSRLTQVIVEGLY